MPQSPKPNEADKAARVQLAERVSFLECEIENLKSRLNDHSQLEKLALRVSNCESLAGIIGPVKDE